MSLTIASPNIFFKICLLVFCNFYDFDSFLPRVIKHLPLLIKSEGFTKNQNSENLT